MRRLVLLSCLLLAPGIARADDAKPTSLTVEQAINLATALQGLDGYQQVIKGASGESSVTQHYKFDALTLLALAHDMSALRPIIIDARTAHDKKLAELSAGGPLACVDAPVTPGTAAYNQMQAEDAQINASKHAVDLTQISVADLKLDPPTSNPIPPSVLAGLSPILKTGAAAK